MHPLQQMMRPKVKVLLLLLFVRSKASVYQTQYYRIHIKKIDSACGDGSLILLFALILTFCQAQWGNMAGGALYPWIRAGDGWEVGGAGGWYRGAELAGVLAVLHFNRGSSARGPQCTWRPAWSPRMWAWSETRAAGSHIDPRHATRRCRNISLPGRRPSHQSLQQRGLRADEERVREITEMVTFWQPGTVYMCFHTHFTSGGQKKESLAWNSCGSWLPFVVSRGHISQWRWVRWEHTIMHNDRGGNRLSSYHWICNLPTIKCDYLLYLQIVGAPGPLV